MRIVIALWRLAETTVEVGDEGGRPGIRGLPCADAAQPELLHEPVLQRLVGPLHASLGLTAVRAERVDIELVQRAPELRDPFARRLRALLHVKDAGLVAV